nr:retrovirus-related Pol polyprotein from transposon TNT 1-94 [Tanacetum cinerariifolium]
MRPFGCPVTILNTLDHLGKFDGKADEGFLVGYLVDSKAFRVFNSRTRKVKENMHVNFLENKPNVAGSGPEWLFDIDSLTKSMNYEPVTIENQSNIDAGDVNAGDIQGDVDEILRNDDLSYMRLGILPTPWHDTFRSSIPPNTTDSNHTNMLTLEASGIFDGAFDDKDLVAEADQTT